jgi:hypothetical protein
MAKLPQQCMAKLQNAIQSLQQLTNASFSATDEKLGAMLKMLTGVQSNLPSRSAKDDEAEMNDRLQDCIDRLYEIHDQRNGTLYMDSTEAQDVIEDVVEILKSLLDGVTMVESRRGSGKWKASDYNNSTGGPQMDVQEQWTVKRMRGILESTQSTVIQDLSEYTISFVIYLTTVQL